MTAILDMLEALKRSSAILADFVRSIPDEILMRKRGEEFWTIAEHVNHLAEVQSMLGDRIRRFLEEAHPEFVPFFPNEDEPIPEDLQIDVSIALAAFSEGRAEQIKLLQAATPADWEKTATHPEYEQYSLIILARHILMHDHWHMYRMEELWLTRDQYLTNFMDGN